MNNTQFRKAFKLVLCNKNQTETRSSVALTWSVNWYQRVTLLRLTQIADCKNMIWTIPISFERYTIASANTLDWFYRWDLIGEYCLKHDDSANAFAKHGHKQRLPMNWMYICVCVFLIHVMCSKLSTQLT